MRRAALLLAGVALAALSALPVPASAAGVARLGYVGRVAETDAFVGIVIRGSAVTAYVCDGRKLARWFEGTIADRRARLRSKSGGRIKLEVLGARRARGVLRLPGRKALRFVARAARGRAGLFRDERAVTTESGQPGRALTGWVRLNGGALRGASVTHAYRIEHPTPDITVFLETDTDGTVSPPPGGPESGQRLSVLPICRWFTGTTSSGSRRALTTPGCGVPRTGITPTRPTGPRVISRPSDFPLSQEALALFADRIDDQLRRQRLDLLRRAGQTDRAAIPATSRAKIATREGAMLQDSRLLSAAEALRRGTPSEVIRRTEAYANLARPHLDKVRALVPGGDPLVAIHERSSAQPVSLPVRRTFTGPWAETSNITTDGDDWEFDDNSYEICSGFVLCPILLNIVSAATRVDVHVRAGFGSSITWDRAHLLAFDIPPNAGRVQVDIDGTQLDLEVETQNCFGAAHGKTNTAYSIYEVGSDGVVDPFNEPALAGVMSFLWMDEDDLGLLPDDCLPTAPPVPEAPDLNIVDEADALIEFTAPPAGGSYILSASVEAHAEVFLGGTAVSQGRLGVDSVTISHG